MSDSIDKRVRKYYYFRSFFYCLYLITLLVAMIFIILFDIFESAGIFLISYVAFLGIISLFLFAYEKEKDIPKLKMQPSKFFTTAFLIICLTKLLFITWYIEHPIFEFSLYIVLTFLDFLYDIKKIKDL